MKIPNPKFQIPNKLQAPNSNGARWLETDLEFEVCGLEFVWDLKFVVWNF